jgi:hypothetical protein
MHDANRFKLLGIYKTPRLRAGQIVSCERRGAATITGVSEAPVPLAAGSRGPPAARRQRGPAEAGAGSTRGSELPPLSFPIPFLSVLAASRHVCVRKVGSQESISPVPRVA